MSWSLASNLAHRSTAIKGCYGGTIYAIGDQAHQAEHSDHNPDSRGIVHAIDVMYAAGSPHAISTLKWTLSDTTDLQYVIHDHKIYERANGFAPRAYSGSDPHTNHIHISGRHGSVGANSATGTGYSTAAEAYIPKGSPCVPFSPTPLPVKDEFDMATVDQVVNGLLAKKLGSSGPTVGVALQSGYRNTVTLKAELDEVKAELEALKVVVDGLAAPKA